MLTRRLLACLTAAMVWLAAAAADPIVGRWQVNAGGAVFDVQPLPGRTDAFVMLWVDGPDFSLEPGTEIGRIFTTAEPGAYDCHAATDPADKDCASARPTSSSDSPTPTLTR